MVTKIKRHRIDPDLTVTLDVIRAVAAIYVIFHHFAQARGWTSGVAYFFKFGSEAVIVFFLLSGFVIYANEFDRCSNLFEYYFRRIRRIYPTLIGALVLSTCVAIDNENFTRLFSWSSLFGNLANLQDISYLKPGVLIDPFLKNEPLWSLSYEFFFYAIFPAVLYLGSRRPILTNHVIGFFCCCSYMWYSYSPGHFSLVMSYFLIWWTGAMAAKSYLDGFCSFSKIGSAVGWLFALFCISLIIVAKHGFQGFHQYPFLQARHFGCALFLLAVGISPFGETLSRKIKVWRISLSYVASISYGLYLFHYPILIQSSRSENVLGLLFMLLLLVLLSHMIDREMNKKLPRRIMRVNDTRSSHNSLSIS